MRAWFLKATAIILLVWNICAIWVIISMQRRMSRIERASTEIARNQSEISTDLLRLTNHQWNNMCLDVSRIEMYELVRLRLELFGKQAKQVQETKRLCGSCDYVH